MGDVSVTFKKVNKIQQVRKELPIVVDDILAETYQEAASLARQLCPVDTGALRDSIAVLRVRLHLWKLIAGADYAKFVEYGTVFSAAQPFMNPAIKAAQPRLIRRLAQIEWRLRQKIAA